MTQQARGLVDALLRRTADVQKSAAQEPSRNKSELTDILIPEPCGEFDDEHKRIVDILARLLVKGPATKPGAD